MNFNLHDLAAILFVALTLWANGRYLWSAIQGKTVPHFITWLGLGTITLLGALLQLQSGAGVGAVPLFVAAAMNFSNCVAGFLGWYRHLRHEPVGEDHTKALYVTKSDYVAGALALLAVVLWQLSDNPVAAVILLTAASLLAFLPTIRRSWKAPKLELLFTYQLSTVRYIFAVLAVEQFSFVTVLLPATWIFVNAGFTWFLISRKRTLALQAPQPA